MTRRTIKKRLEAVKLSAEALAKLRDSHIYPGFDYKETLKELLEFYSNREIVDFLKGATDERVGSTGYISNLKKGRNIPSHPLGELIYILYVETFNKRPEDYVDGKIPRHKPPNRTFPIVNR